MNSLNTYRNLLFLFAFTFSLGSNAQLKDPTFQFNPQRWDIVEGIVSDEIAATNRSILQDIIYQSKLMDAETFSINNMDAYFKIDAPKLPFLSLKFIASAIAKESG
mgnify:CR=1 FL=1